MFSKYTQLHFYLIKNIENSGHYRLDQNLTKTRGHGHLCLAAYEVIRVHNTDNRYTDESRRQNNTKLMVQHI